MSLILAVALAAAPTPSAEATIRAGLSQWVKAYNSRDVDGVMKVWDPAIRGWYPGFATEGLAATREIYAPLTKPGFDGTMCLDIVEVDVDEGMAYVHDLWTVKSGGKTREVLRSFEIWRRNKAGEWRITSWISYPEPEPAKLQGRRCKD